MYYHIEFMYFIDFQCISCYTHLGQARRFVTNPLCKLCEQGCCKIANKQGSKGQPPLCGELGASPSLFFSRAPRAQRNFATALLTHLKTFVYLL